MSDADLVQVAELLRRLPTAEIREPNFFQLGGAGYLENPTSDLLALFMGGHPAVPTWLGEALVDLLNERQGASIAPSWNAAIASREVLATCEEEVSEGRLDILVETPEVVIGIENKVYASINNPFTVYDALLRLRGRGKHILRCVLAAPNSQPSAPWPVVTYQMLVERARALLPSQVANRGTDKWTILYSELLDHLSSLSKGRDLRMEEKLASFVCDNYGALTRATEILDDFDTALHKEVARSVSSTLGELGAETHVVEAEGNWPRGRALRVRPECWQSDSWIVLIYRRGDNGSNQPTFRLIAYVDSVACRVQLPQLRSKFEREIATGALEPIFTLGERGIWFELRERLLCIEVRATDPSLSGALEGVRQLTRWIHKAAFARK